jgi:hypothetical protein
MHVSVYFAPTISRSRAVDSSRRDCSVGAAVYRTKVRLSGQVSIEENESKADAMADEYALAQISSRMVVV